MAAERRWWSGRPTAAADKWLFVRGEEAESRFRVKEKPLRSLVWLICMRKTQEATPTRTHTPTHTHSNNKQKVPAWASRLPKKSQIFLLTDRNSVADILIKFPSLAASFSLMPFLRLIFANAYKHTHKSRRWQPTGPTELKKGRGEKKKKLAGGVCERGIPICSPCCTSQSAADCRY